MMLLGLLEEETHSEEVPAAAGEMRFCLGSRLVLPAEATGPRRPGPVSVEEALGGGHAGG
ncbi:hypothetical protein ACFWHQ_34280 [Streptomyces sp. NPDC060334]|uniref:hypothetical protein n=1 Tax=unclassified Streptomyces TaxID=2593676 RepID=UPI003316A862